MQNNNENAKPKPYPACACADCLENAGGRQREHGCAWIVDICPVCNHRTSLTEPKNFGVPRIEGFYYPSINEKRGNQ